MQIADTSPILADPAQVKRSALQIKDSYDYVIIGGGTAGLTVGNRLSEDTSKDVLVIELGYFGDESCIWQPRRIPTPGPNPCARHWFNDTTVPQPFLNNASIQYLAGAVVGGSSAVNGMFFDRGSRADYDAWVELGNPGWGWDDLFPYFKKSVRFSVPSQESAEKFGYTWDEAAYGDGPVWAAYPPWQWVRITSRAWGDLNITSPKEHALGDAVGRFYVPTSQNPINQTRSYARYAYYDPIKDRPNFHLLIGHKVEKLLLSDNGEIEGILFSERNNPQEKFTVKASKETILAAGAVHTPQILELSGIGPKAVLEAAGIEVKVDLPGVGQNFQDHPQPKVVCTFTNDVWPNPSTLAQNVTFQAEAQAEYQTNKTGPLTLALGNEPVFLPLSITHSSPESFLAAVAAQAPGAYLLPDTPEEVKAGYVVQKEVLIKLYSSNKAAVYETFNNGGCPGTIIIQKPFSRGTIHIKSSDPYASPLIDFRVFTNPLDLDQAIEFIKFTRKYIQVPTLSVLAPVITAPALNISDSDTEALIKHVKAVSGPTSFHASGTAAMLPKKLGGVVAPDLTVYDIQGLSIVDASIFPLIPSTHLSATVYAVAEKAADIIKGRA
ncbi:glucose-methanol-choline oxidoreductase [Dendryphion nanum]|uniref:Glucose-methanol-choline oxidoreductase n=1 Tax=Dendryphion nanum TaxID=256645 RepID=A0A9P9E766_9PLEO|nr:glucose-methanol-choline oxidoreductase [Dendryphion nanum]